MQSESGLLSLGSTLESPGGAFYLSTLGDNQTNAI